MATDKRERQRQARAQRKEYEAKSAKRKSLLRRTIIVVIVAAVVVGSIALLRGGSSKSASSTSTTAGPVLTPAQEAAQKKANKVSVAAGCPASPTTRVNDLSWTSPPAMTIDKTKTYTATINTDLGPITVKLDAAAAPQTVNNFAFLSEKGYYHCVIFHRVIPNFMDQTGDPTGTGTGSPGYSIPDENLPPSTASPTYPLGSVVMANTGSPNTGEAQFFIVAGTVGESLPNSYALFGQVTKGMNIVDEINAQGSTANNGTPPKVIHRMLTVTISSQ